MNRITFAKSSTASGTYPEIDSDGNKSTIAIANPQLREWIYAKQLYTSYKALPDDNLAEKTELTKAIINALAQSLIDLFGANYTPEGRTPYLSAYVDKKLKWKLEIEDNDLYIRFKELDGIYNDVTKHFSVAKIEKLVEVDNLKVKKFMRTTKEVWLWYLYRKNPDIDKTKLSEFDDDFE